jgi:hypothetical protein
MRKFKKVILILAGSAAIILVLALLLLQPLSSYLISKYSVKYTGRQITTSGVKFNPITGILGLNDLRIYERGSDSVFFSSEGIYTRISLLKLLRKTTELKSLSIDHPRGVIVMNDTISNFGDLISRFASKNDSAEADTTTENKRISILNVRIIDGEFSYRELQTSVDYTVKKVNIKSSGKRWDSDTVNLQFSFLPAAGEGDVKGDFTLNLKNDDYRIAVQTNKFDLDIIGQSLKTLTNYGKFSANIDLDIKSTGNFNNKKAISTTGQISINDFHFGKETGNDFASFKKLTLSIRRLNPENLIYEYDSISLINPYIKYEKYDYLDNIQRIFGKNGSNIESAKNNEKFNLVIEIARNIKVISSSFFESNFKINSLRIYGGHIKFNDYSVSEKFGIDLTSINVRADSVNKERSRVNFSVKSSIKPFGALSVYISVNPKDTSDFDLQYHINKLTLSMFNPYTITYTSFPIDRGTMEFNGDWRVRNGNIKSMNHLVVIDPRTTRRIRNKDTKWIPVPLVLSFVRERGNVIDYEIPITGDLKDPKFNLMNVINDLLRNIFVKPPSTPYRLQVKNIENEIEKSLTLKWQMRQNSLFEEQEEFIENIAEFLEKSRDAVLAVHPNEYAMKEKEYILFYEAKKKYYSETNNKKLESLSREDEETIDKMSVKDSLFVDYLNHHLKDSLVFTIQEKCHSIIDSSHVNNQYAKLMQERKESFMANFKKYKVDDRVKISKTDVVVPYNGFSFYKIEYNGDYPEDLIKAYQKINELDNKAPRKKFKKERNSAASSKLSTM